MTAETSLNVKDLIYPLFIIEGENIKKEIPSLPGVYHFSVDRLEDERFLPLFYSASSTTRTAAAPAHTTTTALFKRLAEKLKRLQTI